MFKSPFAYVMIATFLAAVVTMLLGVGGMSGKDTPERLARSNRLMFLRVGLCACLLAEILYYVNYLR
jgi:hypothetical protein